MVWMMDNFPISYVGVNAVYGVANILSCGDDDGECQQNHGGDAPGIIFVVSREGRYLGRASGRKPFLF